MQKVGCKKLVSILFILLLVVAMVIMTSGCDKDNSDGDDSGSEVESDYNNSEPDTSENSNNNNNNGTTPGTKEDNTPGTTDNNTDIITTPKYVNPLTGLPTEKDLLGQRPVSIMINNLQKATPQIGIASADILYECLTEGGITRLLMVVLDYEKLNVVGSVRSSRDYFIDFSQNHDAIYIHAGGSVYAYDALSKRDVDNLDGVKMGTISSIMFYRDEERKKTMGYEHSLMTTGEKIVAGIQKKQYRTAIKQNFKNPMQFVDYGKRVTLGGDASLDIRLPYSKGQVVDLVYDKDTGKYLRYQFSGVKHIDGETGEQLAFDNVIVILTDMWVIEGDKNNCLKVITTGEGKGYYATGGRYIPIKWSKSTVDSPIVFTNNDGTPLLLNRGKTFISVIDKDTKYNMNYSD